MIKVFNLNKLKYLKIYKKKIYYYVIKMKYIYVSYSNDEYIIEEIEKLEKENKECDKKLSS